MTYAQFKIWPETSEKYPEFVGKYMFSVRGIGYEALQFLDFPSLIAVCVVDDFGNLVKVG